MKELLEKLNYIQTKLVVPKGQMNTFGNYKYRSCEDILKASKPLLKETETTLVISDEIIMLGNRFYIKATAKLFYEKDMIYVDGWARETEIKKGMDSAQITGAASSYARKYALNGLFAIDDTKDADHTNDGKTESKPEVKVISADQGKLLLETAIYNEWTKDDVLAFAKTLGYERLRDISTQDFSTFTDYFAETKGADHDDRKELSEEG